MSKLLTIFTPVYNREKTLLQLYESLVKQTSSNFIWLVVDDGSVDGSGEIIKKFVEEQKIPIRYIKQENKGKHVAHNLGVKECDTELFFCVDSDDFLVDDAVEDIEKQWETVQNKSNVAGIVAYRGDSRGKIIGTEFPPQCNIAPLQELYAKGKKGDTALVFRRDVIAEFPFPEFPGEKFLRESVVYDEIDKKYSLVILRKVIYVCEYLGDGLTQNTRKHEEKSPMGAALYRYHQYMKSKGWFSRMAYAAAYLYFSKKGSQLGNAIKKLGITMSIAVMPCFLFISIRNEYLLRKLK